MIWLVGFWASLATILYAVVGFPFLLVARGLHAGRGALPTATPPLPSVSVVIAARNEAGCIGAKVERILELGYPRDRLEVVVVSDGSHDGTDEEAARLGPPVRVISQPRSGKAAALNRGVAAATGDVLVFTDANSWFADGALHALVAPFADSTVGGVAGDQRYWSPGPAAPSSDGERAYWSVERLLKAAESRSGSTISATGAIYAVRAELVEPVPPDVTDDFFISTGVIAAGRRLVFAPEAVAFEAVAPSARTELDRKVRIMTRGFTAVARRSALLDPRRTGFYALQLLTHKVLRRLLVVPALTMVVCAAPLARRHRLYGAVAVGGAGFVAAGTAGLVAGDRGGHRPRLLALPAYGCLCGAAALRAGWNVVRGRSITQWEPGR